MAIKTYKNGAFQDITTLKTYKGGAWQEADHSCDYRNGAWQNNWESYSPPTFRFEKYSIGDEVRQTLFAFSDIEKAYNEGLYILKISNLRCYKTRVTFVTGDNDEIGDTYGNLYDSIDYGDITLDLRQRAEGAYYTRYRNISRYGKLSMLYRGDYTGYMSFTATFIKP